MGATISYTVTTSTRAGQTITVDVPNPSEGTVGGVSARLWLAADEQATVTSDSPDSWTIDAQALTRKVTAPVPYDQQHYAHIDASQQKNAVGLTTWATWPDGAREEWSDAQVANAKAIQAAGPQTVEGNQVVGGHEDYHYFAGITFSPMTQADQHAWYTRGIHEAAQFEARNFEERDWELLVSLDGASDGTQISATVKKNGVHVSTLLLTESSSGRCHGTLQ